MSQSTDSPSSPAGSEAAAVAEPQPVAKVTSATTNELPAFGWSAYAERVNGRFAMLGFVAVLAIESLSADTFLHWAGLLP